MTSAILASLYHVSDYHASCPKTADSWCLYQRDKVNGTNYYKSKGSLLVDVRSAILAIYNDLTKPEIPSRCHHGKTQKANECFNGMIWQRIPKIYYVGLEKLQLGVYDAIANFDNGKKACVDILEHLHLKPGYYTRQMCLSENKKRISLSIYKASDICKKRRKILRAKRRHVQDVHIEKEGTSSEAGGY